MKLILPVILTVSLTACLTETNTQKQYRYMSETDEKFSQGKIQEARAAHHEFMKALAEDKRTSADEMLEAKRFHAEICVFARG